MCQNFFDLWPQILDGDVFLKLKNFKDILTVFRNLTMSRNSIVDVFLQNETVVAKLFFRNSKLMFEHNE